MLYMELYTDGASRNNPGESGGGMVLIDGGHKWTKAVYFGIKTNNESEYLALIEGLKLAKQHGAKELRIFMDSELIVKQLKGEYRVKKANLKPLFQQVKELLNGFEWTIHHIVRNKNKEADRLANQAIDSNSGV
ncbi:MAG: ribonuclease HI family protein [Candidatus Altiarchaeota archaeon]|nr:ribonuclease HI family protein [Candidatus Altiarchaeota archaeon]